MSSLIPIIDRSNLGMFNCAPSHLNQTSNHLEVGISPRYLFISLHLKRYHNIWKISFNVQGSRLSLGCYEPSITLVYAMSKHLLFNQMQPQTAAACQQESAKIQPEWWARRCTSKQRNEFIKYKTIYCLLAPRLLVAGSEAASWCGGGGFTSQTPSPAAHSDSLAGDSSCRERTSL